MTADADQPGSHRVGWRASVITPPNLISVSRLGLLAWFLVALFAQNDRILAGSVLAEAGVTDFLDG